MAVQRRAQGLDECLDAKEEGVWKEIWSLHAPAVVKNFAWKVAHDLLPTKGNLDKKKIVPNSVCPICLQEIEDTVHILWGCRSSMGVGRSVGKKIKNLLMGLLKEKGCCNFDGRLWKVMSF